MVALGVAVSFWAFSQMEEAAEARKHTHTVLNSADDLMAVLVDAETGQRGFLLTGDEVFLEPYLAVRDSITGRLKELRQMTLNSAAHQHLDALVPLIDAKLVYLSRNIELRRNHDMVAALANVRGSQGKQLMDSIRAELSSFIQIEEGVRAKHDTEFQSSERLLFILIITASMFALLFALAFAYLTYRELQQRLNKLVHLETLHLLERQEKMNKQLQQANATLQVSEENLAVTLSSIGDAVMTTDAEARVTRLNPIAEQLTGWTQAQAIGRPVDEIFHIINKETRQPATIPVLATLAHGTIQGLANHTVLIARDGCECDIADSCSPIRDRDGQVVGAVLVFRDVTGEYVAQQTLRDQQFYTRSLIESNIDALMTTDPSGIITDVNKQMEVLTGCTRDELIGAPFRKHFTDPERAEAGIKLVLSEKKVANFELTARARDGQETVVSYNATTFYDHDGKLQGVFAAARDISEQKMFDQRLRDQQFYTRSLIESNIDALMTTDPSGIITDVNKQMEALTGCTRDELIGAPFKNYFTDPARAEAGIKRVLSEKKVTDYELTARARDGKETVVSYNATTFYDRDRKLQGVFAAARDVTELKVAEELQRVSSTYARSLIEASLDPLVTINMEGKITDVNEASVQATGVPREQLIGMDFSDYFTEPDKAREGYQKVFSEGLVRDYPLAIRHTTGRTMDVLYNAAVYKDDKGNVLGVFAAARDETVQKQASQYARSLIEASLDPLVTISAQGKITDVNEASVQATGVPREQLIGTDFSDYFTEPDEARVGYQKVFSESFVRDYPLAIRHTTGRIMDVLYNAAVYKNDKNNVLGVFAAARDVTESKRIMREFVETKNFLDNILQSSIKYSIIGKNLDQRIVSWNEGARRNYGYTAEEILGKNSQILHVPEDIESGAVEKLLATAYEKGLAEGDFERIRKDGSRFAASLVVTRRNDATGNPIGYLLMSSDISEKKRAEEQLRFASQYARSLIEASVDPLVTISPEGKITDVNEASVQATGMPREQLIGTDFSDYFTEPGEARAGYQKVFSESLVRDYPLAIRHTTGRIMDVLYNAAVYKDDKSNVLGVFAAARDVTERKRLDQVLRDKNAELEDAKSVAEKANLAKSEFLSSMSHELRTPLNAILGFGQLMESDSPSPTAAQKESIAQILQAGWHLLTLINEILDLAKVESGQVPLSREPVSLVEVILECHGMIEPQAQQRGIKLTFPQFDILYFVNADRIRLKQVLINLLSNAIKYNCKQGTVEVKCTESTPGRICVSIRDTGTGLSPEQLAQLFQPFNRFGQEAGGEEGTGIGLVVTKRLVELMGGIIGVESTVGVGSVFWFEFNSVAEPHLSMKEGEAAALAQSHVPRGARLHTLLYVEDNPANLKLVEQIIARHPDMRLLTAVNGNSGIEIARASQPDVILMDINLPGISGIEALKILREDSSTAHIPVIAISANAMPRDIERGMKAGFCRYITKPIKVNEFMEALDGALESLST
ncbi:MAG: PAS domain S-box protein [Gallionella sp.]|nr:PAS domain S-box protein [Gallionella sp.]